MKTIAYLGPRGSFTNKAVQILYPEGHHLAYSSIPDCMDAVVSGEVECCVVPLENSTEGSVHSTVDYLFRMNELYIVKEYDLPIKQYLMMHPSQVGKPIDMVFSHPQALAQCHDFLRERELSLLEETTSTSKAAEEVKTYRNQPYAAIGPDTCAEAYGLTIIESNIQDSDLNHTRFVSLSKQPYEFDLRKKACSIKSTWYLILPENHAGALHQVLSVFAWRRLNLSKIESRPLKTELGHYFFILDINEHEEAVMMQGAKQELEALGCILFQKGSYPVMN
ncbi:hypothetical protein Q75_10735 [Bacillus coahuilensis p1.1.43]|uniref:Prephenate dehydratase n=1 Tax=Bacillus coahuilensis p1.1.43 TaxID=1150625 RepID=A0A147K720_9BACI|nr:prephenate dehydratase [Bacillus coahuilensis]KUP05856.1 hypothetical protein Q75_10735 [Bacillus coahuilensis p1.1.43]